MNAFEMGWDIGYRRNEAFAREFFRQSYFMGGRMFVSSDDYADLDGIEIDQRRIGEIGSENAHALVDRDISELKVSAKPGELIWITCRFPAMQDDIDTLRSIMSQLKSGE